MGKLLLSGKRTGGKRAKASNPTFLENWLKKDASPVNDNVGRSASAPLKEQKRVYPDEIPGSEDDGLGSSLDGDDISARDEDEQAKLSLSGPVLVNELTTATDNAGNPQGPSLGKRKRPDTKDTHDPEDKSSEHFDLDEAIEDLGDEFKPADSDADDSDDESGFESWSDSDDDDFDLDVDLESEEVQQAINEVALEEEEEVPVEGDGHSPDLSDDKSDNDDDDAVSVSSETAEMDEEHQAENRQRFRARVLAVSNAILDVGIAAGSQTKRSLVYPIIKKYNDDRDALADKLVECMRDSVRLAFGERQVRSIAEVSRSLNRVHQKAYMTGVYGILAHTTSGPVKEAVYVGSSRDIKKRFYEHRSSINRGSTELYAYQTLRETKWKKHYCVLADLGRESEAPWVYFVESVLILLLQAKDPLYCQWRTPPGLNQKVKVTYAGLDVYETVPKPLNRVLPCFDMYSDKYHWKLNTPCPELCELCSESPATKGSLRANQWVCGHCYDKFIRVSNVGRGPCQCPTCDRYMTGIGTDKSYPLGDKRYCFTCLHGYKNNLPPEKHVHKPRIRSSKWGSGLGRCECPGGCTKVCHAGMDYHKRRQRSKAKGVAGLYLCRRCYKYFQYYAERDLEAPPHPVCLRKAHENPIYGACECPGGCPKVYTPESPNEKDRRFCSSVPSVKGRYMCTLCHNYYRLQYARNGDNFAPHAACNPKYQDPRYGRCECPGGCNTEFTPETTDQSHHRWRSSVAGVEGRYLCIRCYNHYKMERWKKTGAPIAKHTKCNAPLRKRGPRVAKAPKK